MVQDTPHHQRRLLTDLHGFRYREVNVHHVERANNSKPELKH
jgi:hypothetical protein